MAEKLADLLGPTPYPLSSPDGIEQLNEIYKHPLNQSEMALVAEPEPEEFTWIYGNGHVHLSDEHTHDELKEIAGVKPDSAGPFAAGYVDVKDKKAAWSVETNIDPRGLAEVLKDFSQEEGWAWDGLYDGAGDPINDDVGPKSSNWHISEYPGGTEMTDRLRTWEDLDTKGWDPKGPEEMRETVPEGDFECGQCGEKFNDFKAYETHGTMMHGEKDYDPIEDGHFPQTGDPDDPLPLRMRNTRPTMSPIASWHLADKEPTDLVQADVPFIYDVEQDTITTGTPGQATTAIRGAFTPGIVEGYYKPGGEILITSSTDIPYTTRHMLELWYHLFPHMEISNVSMEGPDEQTTKIANSMLGHKIKQIVAQDPAAYPAAEALKKAGGEVSVVGGAVRDTLMGRTPKDTDLIVRNLPAQHVEDILNKLPGHVKLTGKNFGVYRYVTHDGPEVEVALPRTDDYSGGTKRADGKVTVDHNMPLEDDLLRRDFTHNSMAVPLDTGELVDPYGGSQDLKNHILRTTHPNSFGEDPTRLLRALVEHSRFGSEPDERTRNEIRENAHRLDGESPEAMKPILQKLFSTPEPSKGIRLAAQTGLLKHMFPELATNFAYDQKNPHHKLSLGEHTMSVLENVEKKSDDPNVRLAALLHDVGKPASAWTDPATGINKYHQKKLLDGTTVGKDHADVGAEIADKRLKEGYNYPNADRNKVVELVKEHMFPSFNSDKGARKFLNKMGENADDLLTLREADHMSKGVPADPADQEEVNNMKGLVEKARESNAPTALNNLAVNGKDILGLGVKPGPQVGEILNNLLQTTIDSPEKNDRDTLLNMAQQQIGGQNEPTT